MEGRPTEADVVVALQEYITKTVNAKGRVYREVGMGRGRADLLIDMEKGLSQDKRYVVEVKISKTSGITNSNRNLSEDIIEQVGQYALASNTKEAHLVVFDFHVNPRKDSKDGLYKEVVNYKGKPVHCWVMHIPKVSSSSLKE